MAKLYFYYEKHKESNLDLRLEHAEAQIHYKQEVLQDGSPHL